MCLKLYQAHTFCIQEKYFATLQHNLWTWWFWIKWIKIFSSKKTPQNWSVASIIFFTIIEIIKCAKSTSLESYLKSPSPKAWKALSRVADQWCKFLYTGTTSIAVSLLIQRWSTSFLTHSISRALMCAVYAQNFWVRLLVTDLGRG